MNEIRETKRNKKSKAGVPLKTGLISTIIIVALVVAFTFPKPTFVQDDGEWQVIWKGDLASAAEADPGVGASGFLEIYLVNHTASPAFHNTSATIEGWCDANDLGYASTDAFSVDSASEVSFDIAVKARWNKTHCWNVDKFIDARVRIKITVTCDNWADGEDISDVEGTLVVTGNNTAWGYLFGIAYWNAVDTLGFQTADDATVTVSQISIEAKF